MPLPLRARRWLRLLLPIGVVTALLPVLVAPATAAAPVSYKEYVALGDSWSADVVILGVASQPTAKYVPLDCFQSNGNYPKQVAKALGVAKFDDRTCGSATSEHFTAPQGGLPLGSTAPAQFDALTPTTDLVTVGIGGNDIGLAGTAASCFNLLPGLTLVPGLNLPSPLGGSCKTANTSGGVDKVDEAIKAAEPVLIERIKAIHDRSPHARVLMLNYMAAIPEKGCWPYVQVNDADVPWLHDKLNGLNALVARVADAAGAELVDTYTPTLGHDVCQLPTVRYVEGFIPLSLNGVAIAVPLHPNSAGAGAQSRILLDAIRGTANPVAVD